MWGASAMSDRRHHSLAAVNSKEIREDWLAELKRRFHRSVTLLDHGLRDPGFNLLAQEINLFTGMIHHAKEKK
jgi:hypothetical protein